MSGRGKLVTSATGKFEQAIQSVSESRAAPYVVRRVDHCAIKSNPQPHVATSFRHQ